MRPIAWRDGGSAVGLIIALAALPVFLPGHDLTTGYQAGLVSAHAVIHHDLTRIGLKRGPGPVERLDLGVDRDRVPRSSRDHRVDQLRPRRRVHDRLVHRGGLSAWFGLTPSTGPVGLIFGLLAVLVVSMIVCGSLNTLIERVGYKPLRGRRSSPR